MSEKSTKLINTILDKYFSIYYPKVEYRYEYQTKKSERLLERTYLVNANKINEYDSITGQLDNLDFFISKLTAIFEYEFINYPLFKGLLFNINMPSLSIPYTKIESRLGIIRRNFGGLHQHEKFKFWISSDDLDQCYKKLSQLFPFFNFLKSKNDDVRLYAYEDQIIFLISTKKDLFGVKKSLVQPKLKEEEFYTTIVKTFNSYFYILKALSLDKSDLEIEKELELKLSNKIEDGDGNS